MSIQEQAIQMINNLSDDNVAYLIDFMKRFMLPADNEISGGAKQKTSPTTANDSDFMEELETLRLGVKKYFPKDFDSRRIWEEAIDEKYSSFN